MVGRKTQPSTVRVVAWLKAVIEKTGGWGELAALAQIEIADACNGVLPPEPASRMDKQGAPLPEVGMYNWHLRSATKGSRAMVGVHTPSGRVEVGEPHVVLVDAQRCVWVELSSVAEWWSKSIGLDSLESASDT